MRELDGGLRVNNEVINFNKCLFSKTDLEITSEHTADSFCGILPPISVYLSV